MDTEKMGKFIAEQRKEKKMTQKELADLLDITDKAVSKWERGLSCPDISLLSTLAELLEVTTGELLNAEKTNTKKCDEPSIEEALQYANMTTKHRMQSFLRISFVLFTVLLIIASFVCAICDFVMTSAFTWSRIPMLSMILAWLILTPLLKMEFNKVRWSLLSLSVCILPYLYILGMLLPEYDLIFPIGFRCSLIGIGYLWIVFYVFHKFKTQKYYASAISTILIIFVDLGVGFLCADLVNDALIDVWDILGIIVILLMAVGQFVLHMKNNQKL